MNPLGFILAFAALLTGCLPGSQAVDSLKFLIIGDMGGLSLPPYTTPIELGTAEEMAAIADLYSPQFILELGDNFYFKGVQDVDDKRFQETFEDVYTAPSLHVPWYLVAGNHDHRGNVSAQIAYSQKSKRWNFPDFWYKLKVPLPGGASLDILMLDTIILAGNLHSDFLRGNQPLPGPSNPFDAERQWQWIEQQLQQSKATYLLVAGHYPIYSVAEHGPTDILVERLLPMLEKYRANAYLSGHDHTLQHLRTNSSGHSLDYVVSGCANFISDSLDHVHDVPPHSLLFHWANVKSLGGLVFAEATPANMTLTFIEARGKLLHRFHMFPRKI